MLETSLLLFHYGVLGFSIIAGVIVIWHMVDAIRNLKQ